MENDYRSSIGEGFEPLQVFSVENEAVCFAVECAKVISSADRAKAIFPMAENA